jgi:hypothetical protein
MSDAPSPPAANAVAAMREVVVRAAEAKLGRPLTWVERATVDGFQSMRMLASMNRRFTNKATTASAVERDLAGLAGFCGLGETPEEPAAADHRAEVMPPSPASTGRLPPSAP